MKRIPIKTHQSFEAGLWNIDIKGKQIYLMGVYHPPATVFSNNIFTDMFLDTLTDHSNILDNTIVTGDFNLHFNDITNADAIYHHDAMFALGFDQHIKTATHQKGNILDPVFTHSISPIKLKKSIVADMISDHRLVICELNVSKPKLKLNTISKKEIHPTIGE